MACSCWFLRALTLLLLLQQCCGQATVQIVYMGAGAGPGTRSLSAQAQVQDRHQAMLAAVVGSHSGLLYSYRKSFDGFAAVLTPAQVASLREMEGVVGVFPSRVRHPATTHSWGFLGLEDGRTDSLWVRSSYGRDTVVGVLDTGIWPESTSFRDDLMGPVPSTWLGECVEGQDFNSTHCNKKLVGARYYYRGLEQTNGGMSPDNVRSARDSLGHGTHTASIAAGRVVVNASVYGLGVGNARGGAPLARIAVYKVCWSEGCSDADILAAFDDAIHDGVDVLSASLGYPPPLFEYFEDVMSVGSFHALQNGILVVSSAGNSGPGPGSVTNAAPWMLTVAASSIDRDFSSLIQLGNNRTFRGAAVNPWDLGSAWYPLVYAGNAQNPSSDVNSTHCLEGTLDPVKVKGAIVLCLHSPSDSTRASKSSSVQSAGGVGLILIDDMQKSVAFSYLIPSTLVDIAVGGAILYYIKTTPSPVATIRRTVEVDKVVPAPTLPQFSARGPNSLTPGILKPDITAPGVNILAAWSPLASPSESLSDSRSVDFNILSGTSMSCPHATGAAALLKTLHPEWSPAAIKSALMTTATVLDNSHHFLANDAGFQAGPLDYGAGQIDPSRAADPGLVYDASTRDFALFLCSSGYTTKLLRLVTGDSSECPASAPGVSNLNYPSITVTEAAGNVSLVRTVTNLGPSPNAVYKAIVQAPQGVQVDVVPSQLTFKELNEKQAFRVDVSILVRSTVGTWLFGSLTWTDGTRSVRSPISISF